MSNTTDSLDYDLSKGLIAAPLASATAFATPQLLNTLDLSFSNVDKKIDKVKNQIADLEATANNSKFVNRPNYRSALYTLAQEDLKAYLEGLKDFKENKSNSKYLLDRKNQIIGESFLEEVHRNALGNRFSRALVGPRERANYLAHRKLRDAIGGYCPLGRRSILALMTALPALGLGGLTISNNKNNDNSTFDISQALAGSALGGAGTLTLGTLGLKAFDNLEEKRLLNNLEKQVKTKDLSPKQVENYIHLKRRQLGYMDNNIDADELGATKRLNESNRYNKLSKRLQNKLFGEVNNPNSFGKMFSNINSKLPKQIQKHLKHLNLRSRVTPLSLATVLAATLGLGNGFNFKKESNIKKANVDFDPTGAVTGGIGAASSLAMANELITDYLPRFLISNTDPRNKTVRTIRNLSISKTGMPGVLGNLLDHLNSKYNDKLRSKYLKNNPNASIDEINKSINADGFRNRSINKIKNFLSHENTKMVETLVQNPEYTKGSNLPKKIKKLVPVDSTVSLAQKYFNPKYMSKKTKGLYLAGLLGSVIGGLNFTDKNKE